MLYQVCLYSELFSTQVNTFPRQLRIVLDAISFAVRVILKESVHFFLELLAFLFTPGYPTTFFSDIQTGTVCVSLTCVQYVPPISSLILTP
jgi:hypothetical protein